VLDLQYFLFNNRWDLEHQSDLYYYPDVPNNRGRNVHSAYSVPDLRWDGHPIARTAYLWSPTFTAYRFHPLPSDL